MVFEDGWTGKGYGFEFASGRAQDLLKGIEPKSTQAARLEAAKVWAILAQAAAMDSLTHKIEEFSFGGQNYEGPMGALIKEVREGFSRISSSIENFNA